MEISYLFNHLSTNFLQFNSKVQIPCVRNRPLAHSRFDHRKCVLKIFHRTYFHYDRKNYIGFSKSDVKDTPPSPKKKQQNKTKMSIISLYQYCVILKSSRKFANGLYICFSVNNALFSITFLRISIIMCSIKLCSINCVQYVLPLDL